MGFTNEDISVYEIDVPGLNSQTELIFLTQEQSGVKYFWLFLVDIGGRKDIFRKVQLLLRVVSNTALTTEADVTVKRAFFKSLSSSS